VFLREGTFRAYVTLISAVSLSGAVSNTTDGAKGYQFGPWVFSFISSCSTFFFHGFQAQFGAFFEGLSKEVFKDVGM